MLQALILKFDVLMQQDDIDRNGEEFHAIKVGKLFIFEKKRFQRKKFK